jgi:CRP-like cAMP-binding protein
MANNMENLAGMSLFKLLNQAELEIVSQTVREKSYLRGENIFVENQDGDTVYVISSGTVKISKLCQGKELEVITLYAGDFFGEIALFERVPRTATARVVENATLILINRDDFARLIAQCPQAGIKILYRIIQDMAKRLQRMNVQSEGMFI